MLHLRFSTYHLKTFVHLQRQWSSISESELYPLVHQQLGLHMQSSGSLFSECRCNHFTIVFPSKIKRPDVNFELVVILVKIPPND